jgi:predicted dehydrogenase
MHLPHIEQLSDRYELVALCDLSETTVANCARRYGVKGAHTRWEEMLSEELDAVLILSSGDHAPIAITAARAGIHVFTEKPMALSTTDCAAMIDAAESADVRLMVGTMKRYDPAYERLAELLPEARDDLVLARVTTLESPLAPYVSHCSLVSGNPPPAELLSELERAERPSLDAALGGADKQTRWCYRWILLDCLVHEFNALRGLLGEATDVVSAELAKHCVNVSLRFGETACHLSWVDLPGIARYKQEFAFYAPDQRFTLVFPSPFLRNMPTRLHVEGGTPGTTCSWEREEIVSFDESFRRELVEFADCIAGGHEPRTSGYDGMADVRVCEAVARAHQGLDAGLTPAGAATEAAHQ